MGRSCPSWVRLRRCRPCRHTATPPLPPLPPLSAEERARLLKAVYPIASLPNKPRNALGFVRGDRPSAEMETLLLAAEPTRNDSLRELALQRALAVRRGLAARGLPSERLFRAAPTLRAADVADPSWSPRVRLSLSTR
jgi:hypothetical protein